MDTAAVLQLDPHRHESGCGKDDGPCDAGPVAVGKLARQRALLVRGHPSASSLATLRCPRGRRIGMISLNPTSAINPIFVIGERIAETIRARKARDPSAGTRALHHGIDRWGHRRSTASLQ
jgi:ABC-type dipeptide/oligopeptide/nickel transport system ATPase component